MKKAAIFLIPTLSLVLVGCTNNKQNNNLVQKQPNITNVYKKTIKDKELNIENKLKKITEQNNKFQVFEDTQYSVKSLLNSISFSNNKININKYNRYKLCRFRPISKPT
ncbi:Hypothetical protein MSC_0346 [Mycoplasma mycoides subsp. mycoides SC str. PG1]|uniref:Lipoprotein n=1 Tax=Mycoplasma mycoides subsp. mycoides SC (strain CCUG 32753 / NCTC 10114 / PG1) TaxID=272632 RepID=Q6MTQ3_MYCMS|nr:Hypothetical protein MSC_0346 [Mycoplasma mycoides subsp. mycoides SC str. PG1]